MQRNRCMWGFFYFFTVIVFFTVANPFILAVIVAFPAFLAVILPLELTDNTDGFEDFQVIPFKICAFVLLFPPIIPGYITLHETVNFFYFFTFMVEGALNFSDLVFFLPTSIV